MRMICFNKSPRLLAALVAFSIATPALSTARTGIEQSPSRIQAVDDQQRVSIANSVHPAAKSSIDLGRVSSDTPLPRLTLVFRRSQKQQKDLNTLLEQQQDPASAEYHRWLTPAEFQSRFGINDSDLAAVRTWLQSHGLIVNEEATDHSLIVFSGPAASIEQAFHTEIHHYSASGEEHFANSTDVSLPAALANVITGVRGLNDFRPHPRPHVRKLKSDFTSNISGNHFLAPDDFATIYNLKPLYASGIDGTGQKIAVVGQTDLVPIAISTFRSVSGLPASNPQVILIPGATDPGIVAGDIDEASLDIEWSGAIAPGATIVYVNSKNALDSLQYAIQQNVAPVVSVSYGDCEPNFLQSEIDSLNAMFQQANAQGQTIVGAAGDSGAADCDYPTGTNIVTSAKHGLAVDFPPSSPNVTGIGGSAFNEGSGTFWNATNNSTNGSVLSYIPEVAWNDTAQEISNGGSLAASGGGASTKFTKPTWQTGVGVPADGARDLPDITFAASSDHDGYLACSKGSTNSTTSCVNGYRAADTTLTVVGGTSAGTPAFAGVVALLNQKAGTSQGNINPQLYSLAAANSVIVHDIITGDNKVPCTAGTTDCPSGGSIGYSAGAGYDLVTGLGSLNVTNFISAATGQPILPVPDFQIAAANASLSFHRGSSSSSNIAISALNGFNATVTLTCTVSSGLTNTLCSISPATVNGSGSATLTVSASAIAAAHGLPRHQSSAAPLWFSGAFGLCALLMVGRAPRVAPNKEVLSFLLIAMVAVIGVGCGGGGGSAGSTAITTPSTSSPLTGTVTVQGTSGLTTHAVQIAVTVN